MMGYPAVSIESAADELNRLHQRIKSNTKAARQMKRQYNSLVSKPNRILEKEALLQREFVSHLAGKGLAVKEQFKAGRGRADVVTETSVYELKYGSSDACVFQAMGQLLYYQRYTGGRQLVIVLSEEPSVRMQGVIEDMGIRLEVFPCSL